MIAAQTGSIQDNHTQTAKSWDNQFSQRGLVMHPFDLRVSTCIKKAADTEIDTYRLVPKSNLVNSPKSIHDAHGYICSYLSGSRGWWAWRAEQDLKKAGEFKSLNVSDFRTKAAQRLRDQRLSGQAVSFLHQAFRFRGKANYREALYLAHGKHVENIVKSFTSDMHDVLEGFLCMAGAFSFKCLGDELRDNFIVDIETHRSFDLSPLEIWS